MLLRPPVVLLLALFAATGLAAGGRGDDPVRLILVLAVVLGFLLTAVLVNDLADEEIDRVNLADDPSRLLVAGSSSRREMQVLAVVGAVTALGVACILGGEATLVVAGGLALTLAYSFRPVRLADRGAVAALLLPAGYVAVPYLVGIVAARGSLHAADLPLLGGLYVGFIGRILLKDFRDVRGDALFGKRTFLVRHGRRNTCTVSAACWILGATTLLALRPLTPTLALVFAAHLALALVLLRALVTDAGPRRDEALISSLAIVGRMLVLTVIGHLSMGDAGGSPLVQAALLLALLSLTLGQVVSMLRDGPRTRCTIPDGWIVAAASPESDRQDRVPAPVG
jgi:4-hydroxybenzoate polyprenyltransferase